ncbi:formate dehydrogenase, alpha subunit [Ammonifex degensii KC4]|uniref:Formate dehydrogenase, alpha subunit n=2 Tax=Ammonifex degensii TaxID=42838 RepID=C9RAQ1_AMMDK|nr:formate dehydrogenase, alpha subunit [Ammonifex degensii KC4]
MKEKMVTLVINGKEVTVPEGTTILEAARQAGIYIPTLCHDPELSPWGGCRLCIVEVRGWKELPAACITPVRHGMVVETESPAVRHARYTLIELLLANHPEDCLTCERTGSCVLQDLAYRYGVRRTRFEGEKRNYPIEDSNPFIVRDMNKCILCGLCVRVCNEIMGKAVIDFAYRGVRTKITPPFELPLEKAGCVFCGNCVAVCPVGALFPKPMWGQGRHWEVKKVKTVCPYCGTGCSFYLVVKDERVIGVQSCPDAPVNGRWLCIKGRFGFGFIHHRDRLKMPLIRDPFLFAKVTWPTSLKLVARRLTEIKEKYGPDAIGVLASARITNEEAYLLNKFARAVLGTNNIDHCARLCHAPTLVALREAFGSGAATNQLAEIAEADFILVIGSNTTETHPVAAIQIQKALRRGAVLAVIDPRRTEIASRAHYHLQLRPGTDIALLNAIAHVCLQENLWNQEFVIYRTENFAAFREAAMQYPPSLAAAITGVPEELIIEVARHYARAKNAVIIYTMGITQHTCGTNNVYAIANLALLCGHVGRRGSGVLPLRGQNNVQGACDMGALPDYLPGYQAVTDPSVRAKFAAAWGVEIPDHPGLTATEMFEAAAEGRIKALYIVGENPMVTKADTSLVKKALENLEFLVVQDIFLTETARFAHVVLPAASFAEKDGTFTNTERRIQRVRRAINPVGEAKPDWEIVTLLAREMGHPWNYSSPAAIMEEIAQLTPIYGGVSYERLEAEPEGIFWPCPHPEHPGTPILHQENFTRGKGRFHPVHFAPPDEQPDKDYPFLLITGRYLTHYHSGTMTRRTPLGFYQETLLEMNPEDMAELGIKPRDRVLISSRHGSMKIDTTPNSNLPRGVVFATFHDADNPINLLVGHRCDPRAKTPAFKGVAVRIEKAVR